MLINYLNVAMEKYIEETLTICINFSIIEEYKGD